MKKKPKQVPVLLKTRSEMFDLLEKVASGEVDPKEASRRAKAANRVLRGLKPRKPRAYR